ncbi:hypothetical protein HC928_08690, partial [bacterium]|nr:hypothetical protein [bacterium]
QPLKACAGISIVKTHYPFARAYELSEELCRSAKQYVKKEREADHVEKEREDAHSAMDWHFAASGLIGSLGEIRAREYTVPAGKLYMRPIEIGSTRSPWRNWSHFQKVVWEFLNGDDWRGHRNKVMALREVLRSGKEPTKQFLKNYRLKNLPKFSTTDSPEIGTISEEGWSDCMCGYFDAIEALDFYVGLEDER